ncbi:anthranilate synthase component I [Mergibacter septicus]|uniref:Anthranilate synthase component 1 n=1 Tax=Mergibacter septicus TaxID=221402 RepID=A0A8D4IX72_9PAST|nr:anthranilate synthase component I [Mergibacter septicus]AWX15256.1 anthranilate synthase component I [Mergibacter septicus]QDJ14510.1 anthranilate synthase component I [Mergibacter septicus]UTU48053.1 anthranilate synthase component I [Mergibacter septicus]WMR96338.1 anthranilate synthase component I [Mergibacter septicus]
MKSPFLQVSQQPIAYQPDTTKLFSQLCYDSSAALLLDSAEIGSKNSLKSLLLVKAAVRISCEGQQVSFQALTANGRAVLTALYAELSRFFPSTVSYDFMNSDTLLLIFNPLNLSLDEDTKLHAKTVFDGLRCLINLYSADTAQQIFLGGLFAYDLVTNFIPMEGIELQDDHLNCPDYCFYLAEQLIVIDHQMQQASLKTFCFTATQLDKLEQDKQAIISQLASSVDFPLQSANTDVTVNLSDDSFKQIVEKLKHHINIGDVFQIVPSRRFSVACPNCLASYRQLKHNNPSPYMFFMQDSVFTLFGASPESALKFNPVDRQLEIYPIAGSRPRGFAENGEIDPELDARLELELRLDHKEQAEHLMLVDLARNDIARVCESGSRKVAELMQVDRYSHIMHLVSRVVGKLRPEFDALHAYQACMNMGTLTGAPKIKAMQLIYQVEQQKRHSYGGAVGYLTSDGSFDTCIVIRSAFVQENVAYIQAGCGEVLDSDPQAEADETRHKAAAVIKAIRQTHQM